MASVAAVRGYLLEEAIAWLLRHSGYRLLVDEQDDRQELTGAGNGLRVKGRGADHQADTLGELLFVPPFSLPIRLFVEAKFRGRPTDMRDVRNAHGVIHDINENFSRSTSAGRPHRRYRYTYALFSTSGFSKDAQTYALAHQISLVDLSGQPFEWLRIAVSGAADGVKHLESEVNRYENVARQLPVLVLRHAVRVALETTHRAPPPVQPSVWTEHESRIAEIANQMRNDLTRAGHDEMLLGFPPAPFVLTMTAQRPFVIDQFLRYARQHPTHRIRLTRRPTSGGTASWQISPEDNSAYGLEFRLPASLEEWIMGSEREISRARMAKLDLLSTIFIYRTSDDEAEVFRLQYSPRRSG